MHIRVTMDWLFGGWFMRFWPIIVMVIAFAGVGLAEVFQRRRQRVLSEPLETTGALLPLLPAIGFWVVSSQVHYSLLLLSIGVLYAALSVLRHSFMYSVMSAIAANGALWYFLSQTRDSISPSTRKSGSFRPRFRAYTAGFINRERLTPEQSAAIRYASAIVIYVSSTADVFINGVAEAPWLPVVLAALSILGVLAGIFCPRAAISLFGHGFLDRCTDDNHLARRHRPATHMDPVDRRDRHRSNHHRRLRPVREAPRRHTARRRRAETLAGLNAAAAVKTSRCKTDRQDIICPLRKITCYVCGTK